MKRVLCGILFLLLPGCIGPKQVPLEQSVQCRPLFPYLTEEEHARIHDISFPLEVQPAKLFLTESQMVLSFLTDLSWQKLSNFYSSRMEYWGWVESGSVQAEESCIIFSKPSKICVVTMRPHKDSQNKVLIFITQKTNLPHSA